MTRTGMINALRTVPVRLRRDWNATHGGCPTCNVAHGLIRAKVCAMAGHFDGDRLTSVFKDLVTDRVVAAGGGTGTVDNAAVAELTSRIVALEAQRPRVTTIQVGDAPKVTLDKGEFAHAALKDVLMAASAGLPILMVGPTGSGKSQLARTVAKALERKMVFNAVTAGISEGVITGRLLPTGDHAKMEYHRSEFVGAYEEGWVYLADEFDAIDPNVALIFNDALANGHATVPHRTKNPYAKRHKDFVFLAAANTFGTGADRQYVGRSQLDAATLSRFDVTTVEVGYDPSLEAALIPAPILGWVTAVRSSINMHRLRRSCSTRTGVNAARLEAVGVKRGDWVKRYFAPWSSEELSRITPNLKRGEAW